jgi:serine/threonine protein phosphatase PrpC
MSMVAERRKWAAIEASVIGASHARANLPNQDAVKVHVTEKGEPRAVLAVSDGHGSAKCFRSDQGSRIAVDIALTELVDFAASSAGLSSREVRQNAEERLPKAIVRRWREAVEEHYRNDPFRDDELSRLDDVTKSTLERARERNDPYIAYGATLVTVLLTGEFFICLQLGDGEVLVVSDKTGQAEQPLEVDEGLIANETTSLCQDDAWKRFRFRFQYLPDSPPPLVLLATDGYPNSFATPEGFRQVAEDLHNLLERDGIETVRESLPAWLAEASQSGSGDDVTVAILYSPGIEPRAAKLSPDAAVDAASVAELPTQPRGPSLFGRLWRWPGVVYIGARRWFRRHPDAGLASALIAVALAAAVCFMRFSPPMLR